MKHFLRLFALIWLGQQALAGGYLALGDSYTIGESVAEDERWPAQLVKRLSADHPLPPLTVLARTGWTSADLLAAMNRSSLADDYTLVTLLIGVNDQFQQLPVADYRRRLDVLLTRAIALAGGEARRVFLLSIPDYAYTPFGAAQGAMGQAAISAGVARFNQVNEELSRNHGVTRFDITPVSQRGLSQPALVARDGLHPSAEQYRQWVKQIAAPIGERLRSLKQAP